MEKDTLQMFGDKHHTRFINNQKQFKQFIQKNK